MGVTKPLSAVSLIFACGTALFSDGYANGIIGSVLTRIYPGSKFGTQSYSDILTSIAFAGTVFGMLLFGWISDKIGRKAGMLSAASIVGVFSALSAGSVGVKNSVGGTIAFLCVCRFIIGIGVGAEYPCGSVSASEQTEQEGIAKNAQHRWLVLATNTMIDIGFVIAAFVPLVLYWIFGVNHLRAIWGLALGLGAFPAFAVLLWRLKMDEPDCYKKNSMKTVQTPYWLVLRRYWKSLLGLSLSWYVSVLISLYPFGIYSSTITNNVTGGNSSLTVVFGWSVVINLFYIPGTVIGAFLIDYLGPKTTMIFGLLSQAIIGFIMSGLYGTLTNHIAAFAVVYGIFLSLGEVGPGNCLGVLAAKTGPTAIRGQYYGLAAAVGKVGAFVGTWVVYVNSAFGGSKTEKGNTGPFWIASGLAIVSALVTFLLVKPLTHDGMKAEDEAFRQYLEDSGFDVSLLGIPGAVSSEASDVEKKGKLDS
ncbi:major facilitator superfamily domain-containing protein [Pisolithus albus]|nr:major facilitator superfamily domain-containing protein [Pisolithus albus]